MKKIILFLIFSTFVLSYSFSQVLTLYSWTWEKKASIPNGKRDRATGFSIDEYGYVGTGLDTGNTALQDFWRFDTLNNVWTQMADFAGGPRRDAIGFSLNHKGYMGTGCSDAAGFMETRDFWEYDPVTNIWTQKADYGGITGANVFKAVGVASKTNGYVIGGRRNNLPIDEIWEYNPTGDLWVPKLPFPGGGRTDAMGFELHGKIYYGTGTDDNFYRQDFWMYNPFVDAWLQKPDFPGDPRTSGIGFSAFNLGFIGLGTDGGYKKDFWAYDDNTETWMFINMFKSDERRGPANFSFNDAAYVCTGKAYNGIKKDNWVLRKNAYTIDITGLAEENVQPIFLKIFPNPMADLVTLQILTQEYLTNMQCEIYNLSGECVRRYSFEESEQLDIYKENLPSGLYIIKISGITSNGEYDQNLQKLIIQ